MACAGRRPPSSLQIDPAALAVAADAIGLLDRRWSGHWSRRWRWLAFIGLFDLRLQGRDLVADLRNLGPALLLCLGKCGVAARIGVLVGVPVVVTGSLIQRGAHAMLAVDEVGDWIRRDSAAQPDAALNLPALQALGDVKLAGEFLDSKCWFGAMRPSSGKVHKACASLCIRGGRPVA